MKKDLFDTVKIKFKFVERCDLFGFLTVLIDNIENMDIESQKKICKSLVDLALLKGKQFIESETKIDQKIFQKGRYVSYHLTLINPNKEKKYISIYIIDLKEEDYAKTRFDIKEFEEI